MIDMFEELRGLELHERLATGQRGRFTPAELITAAGLRPATPPWAGTAAVASRWERPPTW